MSMEDQKIINAAVAKLERFNGGVFHGYRSEVWCTIAEVVKQARASKLEEPCKVVEKPMFSNDWEGFSEYVVDTAQQSNLDVTQSLVSWWKGLAAHREYLRYAAAEKLRLNVAPVVDA